MELTGLQIFKYLPGGKKEANSNCKKCGHPTCMAFAIKLAKQQTDIENCPFVPQELKEIFLDAAKKQQNPIFFGENKQITIGDETVMFRHEKTFINKTAIAFELNSDDKNFDKKLKRFKDYKVERVGEKFTVDTIYLKDNGNIINQAKKLSEEGFALIIETEDKEAIEKLISLNPIFKTSFQNIDRNINITVSANDIDSLAKSSNQLINEGFKNIILDFDINNKFLHQILENLTYIRRLAILQKEMPFTYPVMVKLEQDNLYKTLSIASFLLCKYANIIVLKDFDEALYTSLLTLRQNIYTDPQKPLQVEPKVYEFNEPDENAYVFLTTNFALTYFAVASELESLGKPAYLVVTASDGMSVLTAWSADKFTSELVAKTIKNSDLINKVKVKRIIIPGLLAHMQEELQEVLPEWQIVVGSIEAYKLPDFVKTL